MPTNNYERICIYCRKRNPESREHIPSKTLLVKPYPPNLITLPACTSCNNAYSLDEEYFLNVLAEIGTNKNLSSLKEKDGKVFRARVRSKKLADKINSSLVDIGDELLYLQPEQERIFRILQKIAFGIYCYKYKQIPKMSEVKPLSYYSFNIKEQRPPEVIMLTFTERFISKRWRTIQKNVFSFIVVKDWTRNCALTLILNFHNTFWGIVGIPAIKPTRKRIHRKISCNFQPALFEIL